MPDRGRLYRVALGGCLAAVLWASGVQSQQNAEEPPPPVQEGQGVAGQAPAPQHDGSEGADRQQPPAAQMMPAAPPVEHEAAADPPCGPRCEAAEKREDADLVAQQSMARSAAELLSLTESQLYVGGAGIFLLVVTIGFTIRATNAAVEANRIARESAEQQLRAYVYVVESSLEWKDNRILKVTVKTKNAGQTPAYSRSDWISIGLSGDLNKLPNLGNPSRNDLGPGIEMELR